MPPATEAAHATADQHKVHVSIHPRVAPLSGYSPQKRDEENSSDELRLDRVQMDLLMAVADRSRNWDYSELAEALGRSFEKIRSTMRFLVHEGLVRERVFMLTEDGENIDKKYLLPAEAEIIETLKKKPTTSNGVRVATGQVQATHIGLMQNLQRKELIWPRHFYPSEKGFEILGGESGFVNTYDVKARTMMLLAAGMKTLTSMCAALGSPTNRPVLEKTLAALEQNGWVAKFQIPIGRQNSIDVTSWNLTKAGGERLARYLSSGIAVGAQQGMQQDASADASKKATKGEIKLQILRTLSRAGNEVDLQWLYAELPHDFGAIRRAYGEAVEQKLIEPNVAKLEPGSAQRIEGIDKNSAAGGSKTRIRMIAGELQDGPLSQAEICARLGTSDPEELERALHVMQKLKLITIRKLALTQKGMDLISSNPEAALLRSSRASGATVLQSLKEEEVEKLEEIVSGWGPKRIAKANRLVRNRILKAKVLLEASEGKTSVQVSEALKLNQAFVSRAMSRFNAEGMQSLEPKKAQPRPPMIKVRDLTFEENSKIEMWSNNFDPTRRHAMPYNEFMKLKRARIVYLSSKNTPAQTAVEQTACAIPTYYKTIKDFNKLGMEIFGDTYGLRHSKKPEPKARKLTPEEEDLIDKLSASFEIYKNSELKPRELWRLRRAKAISLSLNDVPNTEISERVGIELPKLRTNINRFNKIGLRIFESVSKGVRKLEPDELSKLKEHVKKFDSIKRGDISYWEYVGLRKAKILVMMYEFVPRSLISSKVECSDSYIDAVVSEFNKSGMKSIAFAPHVEVAMRLRKEKAYKKLKPEDIAKIKTLAAQFVLDEKKGRKSNEYIILRDAKIVDLYMSGMNGDDVGAEVGLPRPQVYLYLDRFDKEGMKRFEITEPKRTVRALKPEELAKIKKISDQFDLSKESQYGRNEFSRLKKARVVLRSSEKALPSVIAKEVDLLPTSVHSAIREFNKKGIKMFDRWEEKHSRKLTPEEREELTAISMNFVVGTRRDSEYRRMRFAKAILLSSDGTPLESVVSQTGMGRSLARKSIELFNMSGMNQFGLSETEKVRNLTPEETQAIKKLSGRYGPEAKSKLIKVDFGLVRAARVVMLSSEKMPPWDIARTLEMQQGRVMQVIAYFNKRGSEMFARGIEKQLRPMNIEEKKRVNALSEAFVALPASQKSEKSFAPLRFARIIRLASKEAFVSDICKEVKMQRQKVLNCIVNFNENGLDIFTAIPGEVIRKLSVDDMERIKELSSRFDPANNSMTGKQAFVLRAARIIIRSLEGAITGAIARETGVSEENVIKIISRFNKRGMRLLESKTPGQQLLKAPTRVLEMPIGGGGITKKMGKKPTRFVRKLTEEEEKVIVSLAQRWQPGNPSRMSRSTYVAVRNAEAIRLSSLKVIAPDIHARTGASMFSIYQAFKEFESSGIAMFGFSKEDLAAIELPEKKRRSWARRPMPISDPKSETAERIVLHMLKAISSSKSSDPRKIFASLPFDNRQLGAAFKTALENGLIGEDLVRITSEGSMTFKNRKQVFDLDQQGILNRIQDKPASVAELALKMPNTNKESMARLVDRLATSKAVTVTKVYITQKGEEYLRANLKTLLRA